MNSVVVLQIPKKGVMIKVALCSLCIEIFGRSVSLKLCITVNFFSIYVCCCISHPFGHDYNSTPALSDHNEALNITLKEGGNSQKIFSLV